MIVVEFDLKSSRYPSRRVPFTPIPGQNAGNLRGKMVRSPFCGTYRQVTFLQRSFTRDKLRSFLIFWTCAEGVGSFRSLLEPLRTHHPQKGAKHCCLGKFFLILWFVSVQLDNIQLHCFLDLDANLERSTLPLYCSPLMFWPVNLSPLRFDKCVILPTA